MREIIWIHIGQAGVQIGQQFWQQMMREHNIQQDWTAVPPGTIGNQETMFRETEEGKYMPRAIFIDTDDRTIEQVMNTDIRKSKEDKQFIFDKEDWSNNFARGYYTVGKRNMEKIILELSNEFIYRKSLCRNP